MDSYQKIEQLIEEVSRLQQELTALRTRKTKTQEASLQKILQKEITEMIEAIDRTETELATKKSCRTQKYYSYESLGFSATKLHSRRIIPL